MDFLDIFKSHEIRSKKLIALFIIIGVIFWFSTPIYILYFNKIDPNNIKEVDIWSYQEMLEKDLVITEPRTINEIISFINDQKYHVRGKGESGKPKALHIMMLDKENMTTVYDVLERGDNSYGLLNNVTFFATIAYLNDEDILELNNIIGLSVSK